MTEGDRPQDVGRAHRRAGELAPETAAILERYRSAMRRELGAVLDELEPPATVQTSIDGAADRPVGLGITARRERWDLAIKLGRELAGGSDAGMTDAPADLISAGASTASRGKAPRLSARERRALGVD